MRMLSNAGIPTISADDLAHSCIRRGKPPYRAIVRAFGQEVLAENHEIDRRKLGKIVFTTPAMRKRLEKIVHPCVAKGLKRFIRSRKGIIALDIPLLFEAKYEEWVDKIVVVYCSRAQQIKRLISRRRLTRREAFQRIAAQMSLSSKRRRADIVLNNTGTPASLRRQVQKKLLT